MSLTLSNVAVTCAICYLLYQIAMWHVRRRNLYKLASKFSGPPVLPFIGNAHQVAGSSEYLLSKLNELGKVYTSPFRIWVGPRLLLFFTDPEQAQEICANPKTLGKGEMADFAQPLVGTGLFTAPVSKWKVHRKLIQPTFNKQILDSFVEVFASQSKLFTEQLEENLDGPEFEIFSLSLLCTLDMICETAMGVNVGAQTNRNHEYVEALENVVAGFCKRIFSLWLHPDLIFNRTQLSRDQSKYIKFLHDFTDNVIQTRKNKLVKCNAPSETTGIDDYSSESVPRRKAFLDHLITQPDEITTLTDVALREEVITMVMAGHDTTAIANSYAMLMLASHPNIQEKVYRELCEIYGDDSVEDHPVTCKDLPRMVYLERVIKETLRLFPVLPYFVRLVTEDLDIGDITLPNGSLAAIGILPLHRSEKYWQDPLKFDPDRFLPEEVAKRHPYSYIPFSGGPRNCIGLVYGMMSMKTLVATVLRRYILKKDDIVPVKDIRLKLESFLKPVDPIKIRIERRTGSTSTLQLAGQGGKTGSK